MNEEKDDILQSHLKAIEGAGAYEYDGWFYARLRARMDAMPRASEGLLARRPAWVLGFMFLLLAWNIWAIRSNGGRFESRTDGLVAFVQAYDTTTDTDFE